MKKLVDRHQRALLNFFMRRSHSIWDAEELTQEVFCKIYRNNDMAVDDYAEPYVYTIAWNVLLDRSRREKVRRREMHISYEETMEQESSFSLEQDAIADELYARFLKALDRLTPRTREVFVLSRYEGLSYTEIAEHCDLSLSAVEKHMTKALQRMRELLRE